MRKNRFTEAQIIGMLKEQEAGLPTAEQCRKHGLSPATFYKLKARYGGMDLSDANRLKQLEAGNARLKRLVADVMPDNVVLKDLLGRSHGPPTGPRTMAEILTTPLQRRDAVLRAMRVEPVNATGSSELATCDLSTPGLRPDRCRSQDRAARASAR